jgi:hypothetical protein
MVMVSSKSKLILTITYLSRKASLILTTTTLILLLFIILSLNLPRWRNQNILTALPLRWHHRHILFILLCPPIVFVVFAFAVGYFEVGGF